MERKIGEIFELGGEWYQCLEEKTHTCFGCNFRDYNCNDISLKEVKGSCQSERRKDNKSVIFKKLEKAGKSITVKGRTFQRLILDNCSCMGCVFNVQSKECHKDSYIDGLCSDDEIWVEIKQNKENMEENKQCDDNKFRVIARAKKRLLQAMNIAEDKKELEMLDSFLLCCWQMGWLKQCEEEIEKEDLKTFSLEDAKAGKPICTTDGKNVRIVCFDKIGAYPVIALVQEEGIETCHFYSQDGKCADCGNEYDLMMLREKKKGYVNIYSNMIHATLEDADKARENANDSNYIETLEVEWKE